MKFIIYLLKICTSELLLENRRSKGALGALWGMALGVEGYMALGDHKIDHGKGSRALHIKYYSKIGSFG